MRARPADTPRVADQTAGRGKPGVTAGTIQRRRHPARARPRGAARAARAARPARRRRRPRDRRRAPRRCAARAEGAGRLGALAGGRALRRVARRGRRAAAPDSRTPSRRKLDENAVAEALAAPPGAPYLKIDPLKIDNDLVAKTLSRPFARRHVVIPVGATPDGIVIAVTDPFDTALRDSLEQLIQAPLRYVVSAKCDIIAIIDRVYGFRSKVSQAAGAARRAASAGGALVQLVELRSQRRARRHHQRRARGRGGRLPAQLRLRAARLRHPPRAARQGRGDALPDRRDPPRHRDRSRSPCTAPSPRASRCWPA